MQHAAVRKEAYEERDARLARYREEDDVRLKGRRVKVEVRQQARVTRKGYACFLAVLVTLFGLLFLVAQLNIAATQQGYRLKAVERQIEEERKEQEALKLEVARLESPARIEKIATETLKMVLPVNSELVRVPAEAGQGGQAGLADAGYGDNLGSAAALYEGSGTQ